MIVLSVPDMSCDHCKARVEAAVRAVAPGADVTVDLSARQVTVGTGAPAPAILAALEAAGYPARLA